MSGQKPSTIRKPTDRAFDDPAVSISSQAASILQGWSFATSPMRADHFDPTRMQRVPQPVSICGPIVDQVSWMAIGHLEVQQCFDRIHFSHIGRNGHCREGQTTTVNEQHDFRPLPAFGVADLQSPFFAEENVPSAITCSNFSRLRRSNVDSNRFQASVSAPLSVQRRWRRQQVTDDGYRSGKNFHWAPVRRIQITPSRQALASARGRPPSGEGDGFSNRSLIKFHWASDKNGGGAVLDPVVFGRRRCGHEDRVTSM